MWIVVLYWQAEVHSAREPKHRLATLTGLNQSVHSFTYDSTPLF